MLANTFYLLGIAHIIKPLWLGHWKKYQHIRNFRKRQANEANSRA